MTFHYKKKYSNSAKYLRIILNVQDAWRLLQDALDIFRMISCRLVKCARFVTFLAVVCARDFFRGSKTRRVATWTTNFYNYNIWTHDIAHGTGNDPRNHPRNGSRFRKIFSFDHWYVASYHNNRAKFISDIPSEEDSLARFVLEPTSS